MLTKAEMRAAYEADKAAMTHEEMIAWHVAHAEISEEEQRSKSQIAAFHDVLCYIEEYDDAKAFIPAGFKELEDMTLLEYEDEASVCSSEDVVSLIKEVNEPRHQEGLALLDELDSGLSIDKIRDLCSRMKKAMLTGMTCQVIMSFNSYEMYKCFKGFKSESGEILAKTISMYDGSEVCFSNYEEYCDWICKNQSKYCKGRGKIMKE